MFCKPITLLIGLLCLLLLTQNVQADFPRDAQGNANACRAKYNDAYFAIMRFCNKGDIVVPSAYAIGGKKFGKIKASIKNKCGSNMNSHPTWVPQEWCFRQFFATCNGPRDKKGNIRKKWSYKNCQEYRILKT